MIHGQVFYWKDIAVKLDEAKWPDADWEKAAWWYNTWMSSEDLETAELSYVNVENGNDWCTLFFCPPDIQPDDRLRIRFGPYHD